MNRSLVKLALVTGVACGVPAIAWGVGWRPTLPVTTSPWLVLAAGGVAVVGALAMAALLRLPELARGLAGGGRSLDAEFDELADLAETARRDGVLVAAADARTKRSPVLVAGFLLLMRDPDEGLMRSSLDIEGEVVERDGSAARALGARVCRAASAVLLMAAVGVAGVLAGHSAGPLSVSAGTAGMALAVVLGFFTWHAAGSRLAAALERENARHALRTEAMIQTMLGIRAGEDYRTVRARLARLMPAAAVDAGQDATLMAA